MAQVKTGTADKLVSGAVRVELAGAVTMIRVINTGSNALRVRIPELGDDFDEIAAGDDEIYRSVGNSISEVYVACNGTSTTYRIKSLAGSVNRA